MKFGQKLTTIPNASQTHLTTDMPLCATLLGKFDNSLQKLKSSAGSSGELTQEIKTDGFCHPAARFWQGDRRNAWFALGRGAGHRRRAGSPLSNLFVERDVTTGEQNPLTAAI